MECLLHLSPLQKIVAWKLFIAQALHISKSFVENTLSIRTIIELIKDPSTIELNDSISIVNLAIIIRKPILKVLTILIMQKLIIFPHPVRIIDCSLVV
jgi:hypothetical protein